MPEPTSALQFMKEASVDGTPVCLHFGDTRTRCHAFPVSEDPRNGDLAFEVLKWFDRTVGPPPGTATAIDVRALGVIHTYAATMVHPGADYVVVSRPRFLRRIQRRAWLRVRAEPNAWIRLRDEDGARVRFMRDLSAGGVGILARSGDDDLAPGLRIPRVEFGLNYMVFVRRGVVRRIHEFTTPRGPERMAGIEFDPVPDSERDRIVSYVMERERTSAVERRRGALENPLPRGGK